MSRRITSADVIVAAVAMAGAAASIIVAPGLRGVLGAGLALLMSAIAVIDSRRFIIPNALTAAAFMLGLVDAVFAAWPDAIWPAIGLAATRGAMLALLFLGLRVIYRRLRGVDGLGLGDVKLAAVAGAWLDWLIIPIAIEMAALAALTMYGLRQHWRGRPLRRAGRLPFGMYLGPAIWVGWVLQVTWLIMP